MTLLLNIEDGSIRICKENFPGCNSSYKLMNKHRCWHVFDKNVVLPQYIMYYELERKGVITVSYINILKMIF